LLLLGVATGSACRTVSDMTEPFHDVPIKSPLTRTQVIELQRAIEAGLLARDARVSGIGFADATEQELKVLEDEGEEARQRFIKANLGLVGMVSRQYAARSQLPNAELFQEGCVGFPLVNYLPVAPRGRAQVHSISLMRS
jgi:DNA-directed RNA polymerase sigma subunit (sigma70/sigma32)